jgi:DNA-binding MarR family transcriptional regulator
MENDERFPGPRYQALLQLLRTADVMWDSSRLLFARWDLSPSQFNVLNLLENKPDGLSQIELGRLLLTHRSNVTGLVDRLEQRGLVGRHDVKADRRAYRIKLTPAGRKLLAQVLPAYYQAAEEVWQGFTTARAKGLATDLQRLSESATKMNSSWSMP